MAESGLRYIWGLWRGGEGRDDKLLGGEWIGDGGGMHGSSDMHAPV